MSWLKQSGHSLRCVGAISLPGSVLLNPKVVAGAYFCRQGVYFEGSQHESRSKKDGMPRQQYNIWSVTATVPGLKPRPLHSKRGMESYADQVQTNYHGRPNGTIIFQV